MRVVKYAMRADTLFHYLVSDLLDVARQELRTLEASQGDVPAHYRNRQAALEVLMAYPYKDAEGRPTPHPGSPDDHLHLTAYEISTEEAKALGVKGSGVSIYTLQDIIQRPDIPIQMKSMAAHITSTRQPSPKLYTHAIAEREAALKKAMEAYKAAFASLSTEKLLTPENITAGHRLVGLLQELMAQGHNKVWVTAPEDGSIAAGAFTAVDPKYFTPVEQATRGHINNCMEYTRSDNRVCGAPVEIYYNPMELSEIESVMNVDSTASWLLKLAKDHNVPIITARYKQPPSEVSALGMLVIAQKGVSKAFHYIINFTNTPAELADRAAVNAHEIRHFYQRLILPQEARNLLNPCDSLLTDFLCEADAKAIGYKVAWSLTNKGKLVRNQKHFKIAKFNDQYYKQGKQVAKATQSCFIAFLEEELADPLYLKEYVAQLIQDGKHPANWMRELSESRFLKSDFLKKLSSVGQMSYLDEDGIQRIRKVLEQLPTVVERLQKQVLESGYKPKM